VHASPTRRPVAQRLRGGLPRGRAGTRRLLALLVATLVLLFAGATSADDRRGAQCTADLEAGLKLLALAEKGDASAAKRAWETFESAERRCPEDVRFPFFGGLAHVYGDDPIGADASLVRLRAQVAVPLRELNRNEGEADLDPHVIFLRAAYAFQLRKMPQVAAEQLLRARMRDPNFYPASVSSLLFKALLGWGADLERRGDVAQAIAQTLRAKEEARYDVDPAKRRDVALRNLAQYYRIANEWPDAIRISADLAARYPKDAVVRYLHASVYADQFDFAHAVEHWKATLDLLAEGKTPAEDAEYLSDAPMRYAISLASLAPAAGRNEEGLTLLRAYAAAHPKDARPRYHLGRFLWDAGKSKEARDELEIAHALDPLCAESLGLLITVYDVARTNVGDDEAKIEKRLAELREKTTDEAKAARKRAIDARKIERKDRTDGCR
jgi:tetratricopeptide (TPR) repeat protein